MTYIYALEAINSMNYLHFGGKAESLSRLINAGLPVPSGYGIASEAFENNALTLYAQQELSELIKSLPSKFTYAVRSSAVGEDGKLLSFAGAYETVLDVKKQDILQAVLTVAASSENERVTAYAEDRDVKVGNIAVVIQRFIKSDYAGVLFTSDIITGSAAVMVGNYVHGIGEQLVSGIADAESFSMNAMKYSYSGNKEFPPYAKNLYTHAVKIRRLFKCPQDIEWAVSNGKVYILQARPITTLNSHNEDSYDINDSLNGEYLLSKTNVGEIFMRPISPATHSVLNSVFDMIGIPLIANIYGQEYCNISALCSIIVSFGVKKEKAYSLISDIAGNLPENVTIPIYPFDKRTLLHKMKKLLFTSKKKVDFGVKDKDFSNNISSIADNLIDKIHQIKNKTELFSFWKDICDVFMTKVMTSIVRGLSVKPLFKTREKLRVIAGEQLTNELCSNCSKDGILESMKPLLSIEDIISGNMTKSEYVKMYGHRHANEMELCCPYPYENPDFPDNAINEYIKSDAKAYEMKSAQAKRYINAVAEFKKLYPSKSKWIDGILDKFSKAVYVREDIRSQSVKLFCLMREFMLKAADLMELRDDIFMLHFSEVMTALRGDETVFKNIPLRRENYNKYLNMPAFPNIILGRFEPESWVSDTNRRLDFYKFGENNTSENSADIKGYAGASGKIEGIARVLTNLSQADLLQQGEILVTTATNIGWVKIFPKVSAIVTDIGAPLSHAAIVARELGVPAVVGCGNATTLLKTGDKIIVDGTNGIVFKI